jgi:branched-chain amino acid transport system ATP-binding protein
MGLSVAAILWVVLGGGIGAWIGSKKGRLPLGFALGFLFGVFGIAAIALMKPTAGALHAAAGGGAGHAGALLEVDHLTMQFGGLVALGDVDFEIRTGEILGLIGPNGAGKTTLFNVITGVYQATSGEARFEGRNLAKTDRHLITKLGIARTFQNIRLFPDMTAVENVMVGTDAHHTTSVIGAMLHLPRHKREEKEGLDRAHELLDFMGIGDRADDAAKNLPYGYQRRLEICRALATDPKLLCLDEPAAGFNPAEKIELMGLIRTIRDQGYTVLLIEHDMSLVMGVTDRIVVLDFGKKIAEGTPAEIRANPAVIAAYLGEAADAS